MKPFIAISLSLFRPSLVCLALAGSGVAFTAAQTAPAPRPASSPTSQEVVELSPFVITSTEEVGYVATSSLAGSRMKTELKDIASQIDVLTPEFLADIGARNIADAVVYSSNFGAPNDQNIGPNDGIAVGSSRTEGRARGMDQATVSSDFFPRISRPTSTTLSGSISPTARSRSSSAWATPAVCSTPPRSGRSSGISARWNYAATPGIRDAQSWM